jgi:integrase
MASIYRRGKKWWGRVTRDGKEHRTSFATTDRRTAEKRLGEWIEELGACAWGDKPRRTYAETEARFIREYLPTLKPGGARRYGVSLKNLVKHFGGCLLYEIGSGLLSEFETLRRADGVKPGTIRRDLACLSSMLTAAIEWEWIDGNPVPAYLKRRAKRGLREAPPRTRYLTEAEEVALLANSSPEVAQGIALAIDTGLRREELFSLTWPQIDFARGVISTTTNTKSGRARKVPLPPRSRTILGTLGRREWELKETMLRDGPQARGTDYVLVNPDTGTRYVSMMKGLKAALRRARVADCSWHDLRRTAGCRWLQRDGKSIEEISILLGHSSPVITAQRYAFLEGETVAASLSGGAQIVKLERRG